MSWDGAHEKKASDINNEIVDLKSKSVTQRKFELEEINGFVLKIKNVRRILLKKYGLKSRDLKQYFELLDTFGKFHDWRKEIQMRSNQVILSTLKEMAFRFNLNYDDLLFYTGEDIKKLCFLKKKVALGVIKKRKAGVTWVIKDGKVKEYLGQPAKKILDKLVLNQLKVKEINEVKGLSAYQGKISGRALICHFARQANQQIKVGQILITSMTTIDYLPAMKKAAAIITDDGGITCHAAIVSRELKKPCIIGTKNATRIFKDGDFVEVDANIGVVKIIK
jgi:phosphoenolpyruvate synthase/pyruvate phosphate dikinase